jgi:4-oxalocrotonate tautomerase
MPIIEVKVIEGRDRAVLGRAAKAIARTAAQELGAPLETVRVHVVEVPAELWAVGDRLKSE